METGFRSTFVISWSQTELNGQSGVPVDALVEGAIWRWTGEPLCVNGSEALLNLEASNEEKDPRRRAARIVHKLVAAADGETACIEDHEACSAALNMGFEVTDGHASYMVTLIETPSRGFPLLMFTGDRPPSDTGLVVVRAKLKPSFANWLQPQPNGMICMTPQTRIATPEGEQLVEHLSEGDLVLTRDNGAQKVMWVGKQHVSGAQLFDQPDLRPIRVRAGAIRSGHPDADIVVAPHQQILLTGARAREFYDTDAVLISACDLLDERRVVLDHRAHEVVYYYLLLDSHQVIWANGLPVESFHPANTGLHLVDKEDREWLLAMYPRNDYTPIQGAPLPSELPAETAAFGLKNFA